MASGTDSSVELQIPETEINALLSFSEGITNDPTRVLQNWTSTLSNACSWPGVQCAMTQSNQSMNVVGLNLTNLRLEGTISPSLGQLAFLKYIDLSSNSLHGTIPLSIAANCTALQYLDLSHNQISGSIPDYNTYLPSLKILNLAKNELTGSMPSSINSTSIELIDFTYNNISGAFPVHYNCPSLQQLLLAKNSLTGFLPPYIVNITSLQYLNVLGNSLTGTIPLGFSYLAALGLAENHFHGVIPADLFNSSTLQMIDLAANNLTGTIPSVPVNQVEESPLFILGLSENGLTGEVPESIYNFTNLQEFEIARNKLSGGISNRLGNLRYLKVLKYSFNSFHGSIPESIGNLSLLTRLNFQVNSLEGKIPESIGKLTQLQGLYMDHNNFHGGIPLSLSNCTKLVVLELSRNIQLGGTLHSRFFNKLTSLYILDLAFCNLTGQIPTDLAQAGSLNYLSLAGNSLTGSIPPSLFQGLATMQQILNLSQNLLDGCIPNTIDMMISLQYLDISQNKLVGNIPSQITGCVNLHSLNLAQNAIAGSIPQALTELQNLRSLNLSWNQLEGAVPLNFSTITKIYVAGNRALCFANDSDASSYKLQSKMQNINGVTDFCSGSKIKIRNAATDQGSHGYIILISIFCSLFFVLFLIGLYTRWRARKIYRSSKEKLGELQRLKSKIETAAGGYKHRFTHDQLKAATRDFDPLKKIGEGLHGAVYKGQITNTDGTVLKIAVKVLRKSPQLLNLQNNDASACSEDEESTTSSDSSTVKEMRSSFVTELMILSKLRHRNIVRILGYCSNLDINAIILEYMPNSSLEHYLYPTVEGEASTNADNGKKNHNRWDWKTRLRIATGVAEALVYLHSDHDGHQRIIHGDLKPSNILLDQYMEARVADFGISRTLRQVSVKAGHGDHQQMLYAPVTSFRGTIGYCAPEWAFSTQISTKVDVYSYGIVLLEILTRRHPRNDIFGDDMSTTLKELLQYLLLGSRKGSYKIMDLSIMEFVLQDQIPMCDVINFLKIIIMCISKDPKRRPNMREVLSMLKDATISQCYNTTPINITC